MAAPKRPGGNAGKGRRKGTPNKITRDIRDMVVAALNKAGGVKYLTDQAQKNPAAFMTLVGKVLPLQVQAQANASGVNLLEQLAQAAMVIKAQREAGALPAPALLVIEAEPKSAIDGKSDGYGDGSSDKGK
jgi:hypothetical protein